MKAECRSLPYECHKQKYDLSDLAGKCSKISAVLRQAKINKVWMPRVILAMKNLVPNEYETICELTDGIHCEITGAVAGVLEWKRIASSEAGAISRNDHFLYIIAGICGATVTRDTNDTGSVSGKRPDGCLLLDGIPVFRLEEKSKDSELPIAIRELHEKMVSWLPQYGDIPCLIGVAIAGNTLALYRIDTHLEIKQMTSHFNMAKKEDRIAAVRAALHLGNLMLSFKKLIKPSRLDFLTTIPRAVGGSIHLGTDFVTKRYQNATVRNNVVAVLNMIAQKKIENTIRLRGSVENRRLTLTLIPVGYMRAPETQDEMARVIIKVLEVLHQLHMNGWVHCDLRWENIIFYDGSPLLIDFEFARAINTKGPKNIKIQDKQMKVRTHTLNPKP